MQKVDFICGVYFFAKDVAEENKMVQENTAQKSYIMNSSDMIFPSFTL